MDNLRNSTIQYYENNAEKFIHDTVNLKMSEAYDRFLLYLPANAHILDAGCGSGRDSKFFKECGYKVTAFDASKKLCRYAAQLLGQPVINATFDTFSPETKYDGIWACASLLHTNQHSMILTINRLLSMLKRNGILYASWKDGKGERIHEGKYYCDLNFEWFENEKNSLSGTVVEHWLSNDVRVSNPTKWLNVIIAPK